MDAGGLGELLGRCPGVEAVFSRPPQGSTAEEWVVQKSAADNRWRSVAYGGGLWVAVACTGSGDRVMTSSSVILGALSLGRVA